MNRQEHKAPELSVETPDFGKHGKFKVSYRHNSWRLEGSDEVFLNRDKINYQQWLLKNGFGGVPTDPSEPDWALWMGPKEDVPPAWAMRSVINLATWTRWNMERKRRANAHAN